MTPEELTDRFVDIAQNRAKKAGRKFLPEAANDFRNLAATGAQVLLSIADPSERDQSIEKAEKDIVRWTDAMINEAMRLTRVEDYPRDALGERTFQAARLRLCPLPPFC